MASIKELRQKIRSLRNTSKITSAMKLVASSKLKKAQDAMGRNQPYLQNLSQIIDRVLESCSSESFALLTPVSEPRKIRILLISTDKGLCGSFNTNLFKQLQTRIKNEWSHCQIELIAIGKKGTDYFSRRFPVAHLRSEPGLPTKLSSSLSVQFGDESITDFINKEVDAVYLAYNQFHSMVLQEPTIEQLVPIPQWKAKNLSSSHSKNLDYLFEPPAEEMLQKLLPQLIKAKIYRSMLMNILGENVARMNAMENATKNSKDLINRYTLSMNRARQAAITTELSEIVAGAESLKN